MSVENDTYGSSDPRPLPPHRLSREGVMSRRGAALMALTGVTVRNTPENQQEFMAEIGFGGNPDGSPSGDDDSVDHTVDRLAE